LIDGGIEKGEEARELVKAGLKALNVSKSGQSTAILEEIFKQAESYFGTVEKLYLYLLRYEGCSLNKNRISALLIDLEKNISSMTSKISSHRIYFEISKYYWKEKNMQNFI